jgi:hypothetical protein
MANARKNICCKGPASPPKENTHSLRIDLDPTLKVPPETNLK